MADKLKAKFEEGKLVLEVDSNADGQKVLDLKLDLNEGVQELIKRGEPIEGAKLAEFDFSLSKLVLKIDSDRDGEKLIELSLDLAELLDEAGFGK